MSYEVILLDSAKDDLSALKKNEIQAYRKAVALAFMAQVSLTHLAKSGGNGTD